MKTPARRPLEMFTDDELLAELKVRGFELDSIESEPEVVYMPRDDSPEPQEVPPYDAIPEDVVSEDSTL
jgi:hypothetical protein